MTLLQRSRPIMPPPSKKQRSSTSLPPRSESSNRRPSKYRKFDPLTATIREAAIKGFVKVFLDHVKENGGSCKRGIKYKRLKTDKRTMPTLKADLLKRWDKVKKNKSIADEVDGESDSEDESEDSVGESYVDSDSDDGGGLVFGSDDSDDEEEWSDSD